MRHGMMLAFMTLSVAGSQRGNEGATLTTEAWSPVVHKRADNTATAPETRDAEDPPREEADESAPQRVVTTATVEAWPTWFSDVCLAPPVATSPTNSTASFHMEFETFKKPTAKDGPQGQPNVVDSAMQKRQSPPSGLYISEEDVVGSGHNQKERFFTSREPAKRVTFDLFAASDVSPQKDSSWSGHPDIRQAGGPFLVRDKRGGADDEDSGDSMYNSGESFPPPPTCYHEDRYQCPEAETCDEDESAAKLFDAYGFNPSCCHRGSPPPQTTPHSTAVTIDSSDSDEDGMSSDSGGEATLFNASKLVVTSSPARTKCLTIPQGARHGSRPPPMESSL